MASKIIKHIIAAVFMMIVMKTNSLPKEVDNSVGGNNTITEEEYKFGSEEGNNNSDVYLQAEADYYNNTTDPDIVPVATEVYVVNAFYFVVMYAVVFWLIFRF